MERTILHIDQNNFYASVECLCNPQLRDKPVAVGGDPEQRHGVVLAKNQIAKQFGVKTGEALWQARQKCPDIIFVRPHFDKYIHFSHLAKGIYNSYTDRVEAFGLDECWLDLTGCPENDGKYVADELRRRVKGELGITASVGVSFNKVFAKLGSDMKKPDATTVITRGNFREKIWPLPVNELLYVGKATHTKLRRYGIYTIGDLAKSDPVNLRSWLGKNGLMIWSFANGQDQSPVCTSDSVIPVKSIGNSTTTPRDLVTDEDVRITMTVLCESVAARLREQKLNCATVQISIRDNTLHSYERQMKLNYPTCLCSALLNAAFTLFKKHHTSAAPIRSIGVRACDISKSDNVQMSLFPEEIKAQKLNDLECAVDTVRRKYGNFAVQRGNALSDKKLSGIDSGKKRAIHPASFLKQG